MDGIIKRDGSEVPFDSSKIESALKAANAAAAVTAPEMFLRLFSQEASLTHT